MRPAAHGIHVGLRASAPHRSPTGRRKDVALQQISVVVLQPRQHRFQRTPTIGAFFSTSCSARPTSAGLPGSIWFLMPSRPANAHGGKGQIRVRASCRVGSGTRCASPWASANRSEYGWLPNGCGPSRPPLPALVSPAPGYGTNSSSARQKPARELDVLENAADVPQRRLLKPAAVRRQRERYPPSTLMRLEIASWKIGLGMNVTDLPFFGDVLDHVLVHLDVVRHLHQRPEL